MCDMDWEIQVPVKERDNERQLLVGSIARMTRIGAASVLQRIPSAMPTWEAQGDEAGVAFRCRARSPHSTSPVSSFPLSSPIGDHHLCSVALRRIVPPQQVWGTKLV